MTQQNAALVEETNAAIAQTEEQATTLDRIVDIFKIDSAAAVGQTTAAPTVARNYVSHGNAAVDAAWDDL